MTPRLRKGDIVKVLSADGLNVITGVLNCRFQGYWRVDYLGTEFCEYSWYKRDEIALYERKSKNGTKKNTY